MIQDDDMHFAEYSTIGFEDLDTDGAPKVEAKVTAPAAPAAPETKDDENPFPLSPEREVKKADEKDDDEFKDALPGRATDQLPQTQKL